MLIWPAEMQVMRTPVPLRVATPALISRVVRASENIARAPAAENGCAAMHFWSSPVLVASMGWTEKTRRAHPYVQAAESVEGFVDQGQRLVFPGHVKQVLDDLAVGQLLADCVLELLK